MAGTPRDTRELEAFRNRHGGYWRYPYLDFHYLFNHYFPPPELIEELQHALPVLANSYPSGQRALAELMAGWKNAPHFTAERLIVGNGSSELIRILMDRIITKATVPLPTFNEFTTAADGRLHRYALDERNGFTLDADRLVHEAQRSGSDYAVLVNPNNPVGNLIDRASIEWVLRQGLRLVVDEAFMAFTDPAHSAEPLVAEYDGLIVVTSCTKSMGIAGLRLGYALTANAEIASLFRRSLPIWNVNALVEYVIEAYPRFRDAHRTSLRRIADDTRWFEEELRTIDYLIPFPTHTNAVFCRVNGSGRRLAEILFERHGFIVKEGIQQAELTTAASYVRIGVRNRDDNGRLLAALRKIQPVELQSTATADEKSALQAV